MAMKQTMLDESFRATLTEEKLRAMVAKQFAVIGGKGEGVKYVAVMGVREDKEGVAILFTNRHDAEVYAEGLAEAAKRVFGDEPPPKIDG